MTGLAGNRVGVGIYIKNIIYKNKRKYMKNIE